MHKRRRLAEMAASTIAIFVSLVPTTKGGGPHVLLFLLINHHGVNVQNIKGIEARISHMDVSKKDCAL